MLGFQLNVDLQIRLNTEIIDFLINSYYLIIFL
jgi:hypothetical protein